MAGRALLLVGVPRTGETAIALAIAQKLDEQDRESIYRPRHF
jgi:DNA helicase TIP49 (TBP-interacting protein)